MNKALDAFHKLFIFQKRWYDKVFLYSLLLITTLVPLIFSFRTKSVFALPKIYWLAILLVLATSMLIIKIYKEGLKIRKNPINVILATYGFILLFSTIFSVNIYSSLFGTYGRFLGLFTLLSVLLLVFLTINFIRKKEEYIAILTFFFLTSIAVVLLGLLQHYGYFLQEIELNAPASRAFGTMGHANHFGGYIVQMMCISWALFAYFKYKFARISIILLNLLFLFTLFQTSSRGAFMALLGCMFIALISVGILYRSHFKKSFKKILSAALIIVVVSAGIAFGFKEKIKNIEVVERTVSTIEFMRQGNVPDRISWMYSSLEMIKDYPLLGTGVSTYHDVYNEYRRLDYRVPGDEQDRIVPHSTHNEYLNIAATQGIPALAVYLLLLGVVLFTAYRKAFISHDKKESLVIIFMITSLFAYLIQVSISFGTVGTMVPFFMLLGVTYGYTSPARDAYIKVSTITAYTVIFFLFASLNLYAYHRVTKADIFLKLTDALHIHPDFESKGFIYHLDAMERATTHNPYAYKLYEVLGGFYLKQGVRIAQSGPSEDLMKKGISSYKKALALNDTHANTYKDLAVAHTLLAQIYDEVGIKGKAQAEEMEAIEAYEKAIEISPNNPLYRMMAAEMYSDFGNTTRTLELYEEVKEIRPEYPEIDERINSLKSS